MNCYLPLSRIYPGQDRYWMQGADPACMQETLKKFNETILCLDLTKDEKIQGNGLPFCLGSITGLPLKSNSVDFIYCLTVLQYVEDDVKAINEFHRILKPGGRVLITVPTRWSPFFLIRELEIYWGVYPWQSSWNIRPYQYYSRSMIGRLTENKFEIIEIRGYLYNFLPRLTGLCLNLAKKNRHVNKLFSAIKPVIKPQGTVHTSEPTSEPESPVTGIYPARKRHISKISDISYHYLIVLEKR